MAKTFLQVAIVIGGIVAVGLIVAAHPVTGLILVVSVAVLAFLAGRAPIATKEDSPPGGRDKAT